MKYRTSPMQIMMLLEIHYFVYVDQLHMLNDSPASETFMKRLLDAELIEIDPQSGPDEIRVRHPFKTTARGHAMIEKWCNTPLPVLEEKWV